MTFAPLIRQSLRHVKNSQVHHVLLIIAETPVCADQITATKRALVEASSYPLSIVAVHVGRGSCETMRCLEGASGGQRFKNFHLVDFNSVKSEGSQQNWQTMLAASILMKVPRQFR